MIVNNISEIKNSHVGLCFFDGECVICCIVVIVSACRCYVGCVISRTEFNCFRTHTVYNIDSYGCGIDFHDIFTVCTCPDGYGYVPAVNVIVNTYSAVVVNFRYSEIVRC